MENAGQRLKKIRLEKGISLEEVQKKTKIHPNILKAIEGDSFTDLSPVYLKGFLKIYCHFLGQDPKDYIPDYKEPRITSLGNMPKEPVMKIDTGQSFLKTIFSKIGYLRPSPHFKKIIVFVLIFIIAIIALFNLGKAISSKKPKAAPDIQKSAVKPEAKKTREAPKPKPQAATLKNQALKIPLQNDIRLAVRARENCFISVKVDGRMVFQRVLEKGRSESWKAKDRIDLSVGNAQAIELQVNDKVFSNLGTRGQPLKNIVITKQGLNLGR